METKGGKISNKEKFDALSTVLSFLWENQQYGDDWQDEILVLESLAEDLYERSADEQES